VLLLISFIISGFLGIILIIQINYGIWPALRLEFLYWHVQVGIVMTLISLFHALWHINYFKKYFQELNEMNTVRIILLIFLILIFY